MNLWWIGAVLAVFGSVGSNLGINIQKYSFLQNSKRPTCEQRPYTRQPGWALGLGLVIAGSLGDFAALALAAQSIVAPIGSVTLVANMVFAQYWLKETLSRRDLCGTVLIILGSVLTVAFGDHSDPEYSLSDFRRYFGYTASIIYALVVFLFCVALYGLILYLRPMKRRIVETHKSLEMVDSDAVRQQLLKDNVEFQAVIKRYAPWEKSHPFFLCALSGVLGAQSVMFGKMVSSLISTTMQGDNQLFSPFPYIFLISMLFFIFSQIHFLALALAYFDALYCVPIFQCFFILFSTVGGATFFQEFSNFSTMQAIIFPLGVFITLLGVFVLAQRDSSAVAPDGRFEGPGHHVMPASLATVFVDIHRHRHESGSLKRSLSHNWHHGGAVSKVQLDKQAMEQMADKAAEEAKQGGLKLSAEVEASVMREISSIGAVKPAHKRDGSRMMSSMHGQNSRLAVDGAGTPNQLGTWNEEAMSPLSGISGMTPDKARRKMKSRSHPTHFVTPTCLLPSATAATSTACADGSVAAGNASNSHLTPPTAGSPNRDVRLLPAPVARHHQHNPSTPIPASVTAGASNPQQSPTGRFSSRRAQQLSPLLQQQQLAADVSPGLLMVPLHREQSEPVPRLHSPSNNEYEESESHLPLYRPESSVVASVVESSTATGAVEVEREQSEAMPGQLEAIVVER